MPGPESSPGGPIDVTKKSQNEKDVSAFFTALDALVAGDDGSGGNGSTAQKPVVSDRQDPCPDVVGMTSPRKSRLLNLAVGFLCGTPECYAEIGTYQGKSLIAALV